MNISDFDYDLPDGRIAKFPPANRDASKLLVWRQGDITENRFSDIASVLPPESLLVFNNTRVVRARLVMHKAGTQTTLGARIEILCLEPAEPADYERAFAARESCEWLCMVGNSKRWSGNARGDSSSAQQGIPIYIRDNNGTVLLRARRKHPDQRGAEQIIRFEWDSDLTFGQLLELLGRVPIPPYLGRDSEEVDNARYQTVYARVEGSVAAPTAGLHFTPELIGRLRDKGVGFQEVTLHVGAGTFLPVKVENALEHTMHTEHFEVTLAAIEQLLVKSGKIIAVGTTSVRTLESLSALAWRIRRNGDLELAKPVGQFELYDIPEEFDGWTALTTLVDWMRGRGLGTLKGATQIMITPAGFRFRIVEGIVTNFHQPRSTLLLLIAGFTGGGDSWKKIYDYALAHDFRFLSYGDSSLLLR
ncbi:MAG: S-adenosylmethionine:tRNA ribosyltransferase-isomerase [Alistipes sp.]|jgi:S-adenosylmethionine:tRNA ribosyltransferase-isomerase|nr:S-adenosylmethionine:tRNA ribosyltransferase-isomerase [Alistipes sp.]